LKICFRPASLIQVRQFKLLALTDHSGHSEENTIYPLLAEMLKNPRCAGIDVASRGIESNFLFFHKYVKSSLTVSPVNPDFSFHPEGVFFKKNQRRVSLRNYDAVLLRLPHPIPSPFWVFLVKSFPGLLFINSPRGIDTTGSKVFLLNFPDICPPMKRCTTLEDILVFKDRFPIVLKPVKSYGGAGIVKIEDEVVQRAEGGSISFGQFAQELGETDFDYLGVKFLRNVGEGDKRIVVCCGEILGAALRKPAGNSWICNVAMGGHSFGAEADEDERAIIRRIHPMLEKEGILFYGIDTLTSDDGRRTLSEINTTSIGGLPKIAEYSGRPVVRQAAGLLWNYIQQSQLDE